MCYSASEYELRQLKLSVDGQLRSRQDSLKQLQDTVSEWMSTTHSQ